MTIKNLSSHIGCNKTDKKSLKIPKGVIEEEQTIITIMKIIGGKTLKNSENY
jgi:hypothetical protein